MTDFHILLLPILLLKTFMTYTTGRNFTVGLLIPYTAPDTSSVDLFGMRYAPASLLALENINNSTHLLPGHHLSLVWNDTKCDRNLALKALIYQIYEKRVDAVIGPACHCEVGARLANVENIPMISYVSGVIQIFYCTGFPAKWVLMKDCRNSILKMCHNPYLGSASDWLKQIFLATRSIRSTTQFWVVTCHQYGISTLVSQTAFHG